MSLAMIMVGLAAVSFAVFGWVRRKQYDRELERHSISPEELHFLMTSVETVLLFDVRQALDLLAYPELIPGAQRILPEEVLQKTSAIPKDKDVVVYCTCPSDKTSRIVLRRALGLGFSRVKFLRGGLSGWKAMGFPVEPYTGTLTFSAVATAPPTA